MKIKKFSTILLLGIILYSCCKPDIIPPEAEIIEITDITDTSASFKVIVTSWSNAQDDDAFVIYIDTSEITLSSSPLHSEGFIPFVLDSIYAIAVAGLSPNTHYFSRIYYDGLFNIGGPNDLRGFLLGEEKEFTTLPLK